MMRITQDRIEKIQGKLADKRDEITNRKTTLNTMFLILYAVGSIIVLVGSVLNAVNASKSSETESKAGKG